MKPHLVCVGGEDHSLRIPFLLKLQARGFRITAVSSSDGGEFARVGVSHRSFHFDRFSTGSRDWGAVGRFRSLLSELKPDIVQSYDTKPNLLVPLAVRNSAAVVRTINGLGWVFSSSTPRALALRPIYFGLQWLVSRWTDATVFQNREDHRLFCKYGLLGSSLSKLIGSSGIDSDAFGLAQSNGPTSMQLRAELGLEEAEVIIYVGRLTRQKGIPTLLNAVPQVVAQRPNAKFLLVGPIESEGPFAVDRTTLGNLRDHVITLGSRKDVPSLLGMADVFAFPTEYREGVPRVLLEAGLARLPIVASNMPGCSDVVEDGINGYLIPPGEPDKFAAKIIELLEAPRNARTMGAHSVAIVRHKFELENVVRRYSEVYEMILQGRSKQRSDKELKSNSSIDAVGDELHAAHKRRGSQS